MKKTITIFMLALSFAVLVSAETNIEEKNRAADKVFLYPQVGFWEMEIWEDGATKGNTVSSDKIKALLNSNKPGEKYFQDYNTKRTLSMVMLGLTFVCIGGMYGSVYGEKDKSNPDLTGMTAFALAGLTLDIGALFLDQFSYNDLFRSINEYNKALIKN